MNQSSLICGIKATQEVEDMLSKKPLPGTQQMAYYAIKETEYDNDLVAFWLRESVAGMAWPVYHNRYQLQWPVDSSRYSHYLRPEVGRAKAIRNRCNSTDRK